MDLDLLSFCDKLAVDDAKKSMLGFANYTVPQIAKLTITATLAKNREGCSHIVSIKENYG